MDNDWLVSLAEIESGARETLGLIYTPPPTPGGLWQEAILFSLERN